MPIVAPGYRAEENIRVQQPDAGLPVRKGGSFSCSVIGAGGNRPRRGGNVPGRYVDSPSDKRTSTSASLQVRSFPDRPGEPMSVILTFLFCMVSRMFCFLGDVSGVIGASSRVV